MRQISKVWSICAGMLLVSMLAAEATAAPVELSGYFGTADAARISKAVRMSGDGNKIVYVENLSSNFSGQSLSSLVSPQSMTDGDAASVYLYDITSQTRTLVYRSKFSSTTVGPDTLLQSLENGFSVDINRDGSKVAMAYTFTTFSGNRDLLTSSLKIALIDTASLAVTQVASFPIPGWTPQNTPLRMSENASTAVFAYEAVEVASTPSGNTWGISYFGSSKTIRLMAVPLTDSAQPAQLAAAVYGDYSSSNDLVSFLDARYASFFDLSADGTRVVFQYQVTGKVMGMFSDGSGSREIAAMTPGKAAFASISGDGNVVAYADRGGNYAVLYANAFDGGQQREITRNGTYWAGNLILNHDGSTLLYHTSEAGPGSSFGYSSFYSYVIPTNGTGAAVSISRELLDASEDFSKVLTSQVYEPILFLNTLSTTPSSTTTSTSTTSTSTSSTSSTSTSTSSTSTSTTTAATTTSTGATTTTTASTTTTTTASTTTPGQITTVAGNGTAITIGYYGDYDNSAYLGDGGPATSAIINSPAGVAVDAAGNIYTTDGLNRIRKVDTSGQITTVAGNGTYICRYCDGYLGNGGPATSATLFGPNGVAVDAAGNIYIADYYNFRIRKVDTSGVITTVAGNGSATYSGDGGPATSASISSPPGVAVDAAGNIYIADRGNNRIRKVGTDGVITTVAGDGTYGYSGDGGQATSASLATPNGVAVDSIGNIYIADLGNYRIRKVDTSGVITTVAGNGTAGYEGNGGPATSANLFGPLGVAVDAAGNIYIAAAYNIHKVGTDGVITSVAGNGNWGYSGDGGPATSAGLRSPSGVAVDAAGNIYIADTGNHRIRKVQGGGSGGGAATLNVVGGWNLLGNSSSGSLDVAAVFGDGSKVTTVWKWIASKASWAFYAPAIADGGAAYAASKGYDFMTAVAGGEGFWVNAKTAFSASLPAGTAIESVSLQGMAPGWNLIAIGDSKTPSGFNKALSLTSPSAGEIPLNLTTLWAWEPALANWYFYAPSLEKSGGLANYIVSKNYLDFGDKVLDSTMGFWVNKPQQ